MSAAQSIEARAAHLPLFPRYILANLPEICPKQNFRHTNLSELSHSAKDLTPRQAEKLIMFLAGFHQEPAFIRRETGEVGNLNGNPIAIRLTDPNSSTCFDGQCFIESVLATGKDQIGIRITPINQEGAPEIPFLRFDSLTHPRLILNPSGTIIGIKTREQTDYLFGQGDRVELFLDPKSITRTMRNPELDPPEARNTILGGGFSLQLRQIDIANASPLFHIKVDFVGNDINIRDIFEPNSRVYRLSSTTTLILQADKLMFPDSHQIPTLKQAMQSQDLSQLAEHVVGRFIKQDGTALLRLLTIALQLDPTMSTHGIKCQFAVTDHHHPRVKTYAFDFESGSKEEERWNPKSDESYIYWPSQNPRLKQVLNSASWQLPDGASRYAAAWLAAAKIIPESFEPTIRLLTAAQTQIGQQQTFHQPLPVSPEIQESVRSHLSEPDEFLNENLDNLPTRYQPEATMPTKIYTIERLLGNVLPHLINKNVWQSSLTYNENDVEIHQIQLNSTTTLLHIDIDGFKLTYLLNNNVVDSIHSQDKLQPSSLNQLEGILNLLKSESTIPLNFVQAMLHSLREGD